MRRPGFTIIELILVVAILAIIASVALPRFLNFNKQAEYSIARHLTGVLQIARESYFLRLITEGNDATDALGKSSSFYSFVHFGGELGEDRNTAAIGFDIRRLLVDPNAEVYDGNIVLNFKSGATATYTISGTGAISAEYANF